MTITYHGENYFKIQSGDSLILIDPLDKRSFKGAGLIINTLRPSLISNNDDESDFFWIDHAGEYEIRGTKIRGWQAGWDNGVEKTIYRLDFSGFRFVFLGYLTKEPAPEIQEFLTSIDILVVPAGGKPYLDPIKVAKFVRQLEPSLVIPSLYKNLKSFLDEFGQQKCRVEDKIVLKKNTDLKLGAIEIVCLKP